MTLQDSFLLESVMDSPVHENGKRIEGCYKNNPFMSKSFANSRRALRSGAEKISKTIRNVRNTFGNLSQVRNIYYYLSTILFLCNIPNLIFNKPK